MIEAPESILAIAGSDARTVPLSGLGPAFEWLDHLLGRAVAAAEAAYGQDAVTGKSFRGLSIDAAEVGRLLARRPGAPVFHPRESGDPEACDDPLANPPQLVWLQRAFSLSSFDLRVVLVALAPELDLRYERLYAYLQDDVTRRRATVDLALNLLCTSPNDKLACRAHFSSDAPLIRKGLLQLVPDPNHVQPPILGYYLKLDEQIVRRLLGQRGLDPRLASFSQLRSPTVDLEGLLLTDEIKRALAKLALRFRETRESVRLYFQGPVGSGKGQAAEALAHAARIPLLAADLRRAPEAREEFEGTLRLLFREAHIENAVLFLEGLDPLRRDDRVVHYHSFMKVLAAHPGITILAGTQPWVPAAGGPPDVVTVSLASPDFGLRRSAWQMNLATAGVDPDEHDVDALASRFRLTPGQIANAVAAARSSALWRAAAEPPSASALPLEPSPANADFFGAARAQCGHELEKLARKLEPKYTWRDIVLPADQLAQLRELCNQAKYRHVVYGEWGFDRKLSMGKGLNALFSGPPGTGKTMAAEVIANELQLDAYKIDLSQVVSKYIGETEKNLDRIFAAAAASNAILFFDEADALFGKRSEVKDAHDRYANIEIGYLLQKMEEYEGVAILATNLRQNLDEAFVRRMHVIVEFPFPGEGERHRIWQGIWPQETPRGADLDFQVLARRFEIAGGNIRNVALAAAFFAADDGGVISTAHLTRAIRREYQKMGKVFVEQI